MDYLVKVLIFIFIALVAVTFAQNNTGGQTTVVTDNVEEDGKTSLEKGMEPVFSLYHNFLETVMSKSFYDSDTPFNVQKLNELIRDENYSELQDKWQDLVKTYGGIAGCIICGMLFILFMPIAGLIYCCCHCCCHKCGGTKAKRDPNRAGCMRATFAGILLICTTLVLFGSIVTFLSADLLKKSLKDENHEGLLSTVDTNLQALQNFSDSTIKEVKNEARQKIMIEGLGEILPKVESAVNETVEKIKRTINATQLLKQADDLGIDAKTALNDIQKIRYSLDNLTALQTNMTTTLHNIKSNIDSACTAPCSIDTSGLKFQPNFENLNKLDEELNKTTSASSIDQSVKNARDEFNKISKNVDIKVNESIVEAKKQIGEINGTVERSITDLDGQAEPFIKSIQEGRDTIKDEKDLFQDIGNYTWYACIGMGCAVLIVVVFYYLGVLFGLCGERPGFNAACCNRGTGANLLCAGILFSFLFAALLMMVVILMFTLGGLGYTMACRYLDDGVENIKVIEPVLSDGFKWNISKTFNVTNLTIGQMFQGCKDNEGVYTALKLNSIFNIDEKFNVSDVKKQVRDMTSKSFNLDDITLLTPELEEELRSYVNANLTTINFTQYFEQLDTAVTGVDLTQTITDLKQAAGTIRPINSTNADALVDAANELENLQDGQLKALDDEKIILREAVNSLREHSRTTTNEVDRLITNIKKAQSDFNNGKENITKTQIGHAVDDILAVIDRTVNSTKDAIENRIGKCKPLYTAAQNVADAVCVKTLDPFNAIWFGLGMSLFFYIPCIIFAALLANLYQRSDKYVAKGKFDDQDYPGYAGYGGRGGQEDMFPLTSTGGGDRRDRSNGSYNQGYDGRDQVPESRYHREGNYNAPRGYDDGGRGGRHVYDRPMMDRHDNNPAYESPPHYDEAVSSAAYRHGGYPKDPRY